MSRSTDRIEKRVLLRAPQETVWHVISDAAEFGSWFGMEFDGFRPGTEMRGRIKPTTVDADVAKMQEPYAGAPVAFFVERIEPMSVLSFRGTVRHRWHGRLLPGTDDPRDVHA